MCRLQGEFGKIFQDDKISDIWIHLTDKGQLILTAAILPPQFIVVCADYLSTVVFCWPRLVLIIPLGKASL